MGDPHGLHRGGPLAGGSVGGGQPVARPVQEQEARPGRGRGAGRFRPPPQPAGARDHRGRAAAGERRQPRHAARAARAGPAHLHGRFRHRLFVAELPALLPLRQDQDRPVLHLGRQGQRRLHGHRAGHRQPRRVLRHDDRRRGRRDARTDEPHPARGLHRRAGLSHQPAHLGPRHPHALRRAGEAHPPCPQPSEAGSRSDE